MTARKSPVWSLAVLPITDLNGWKEVAVAWSRDLRPSFFGSSGIAKLAVPSRWARLLSFRSHKMNTRPICRAIQSVRPFWDDRLAESFSRKAAIASSLALTLMAVLTLRASATTPILTLEDALDVRLMNGNGASYGPPSIATFPDGPFTVSSGTGVDLFGGPAAADATDVLVVLSTDALSAIGTNKIDLSFGSLSVELSKSDFFTTAAGGFPFSSGEHAAINIDFGAPLTKNANLGTLAITSPINLRVDFFGVNNGLIVGNAANSGAEGVAPVPEPVPTVLLMLGMTAVVGFSLFRKFSARSLVSQLTVDRSSLCR
jgi:hypothetical protein